MNDASTLVPDAVERVVHSTNHAWLTLILDLLRHGKEVRPRDKTTKEILGYQTRIPMAEPLVTIRPNLGYRFAVAEPAWIMSGDNRVSTIKPFSKMIHQFSDDGFTYFGAYGPKFVEQVSYVVDCLLNDAHSRQAVMTFWRERPRSTRDVPCTVALQWFIRDAKLECVATMRSSDAWLGWVYDVHTFSALSMYVLILLRNRLTEKNPPACFKPPVLGDLRLTAGSQHLYKSDWAAAEHLTDPINRINEDFKYAPFNADDFATPEALVNHYWCLAKRLQTSGSWLQELAAHVVKKDQER